MKRWQPILPAALCYSLILSAHARAAEWETGAGIAVGGYYSDNICLAQQDKEDKWVGTARPDISVRGRGARGNVSLQAAAEYNSLGDSSLECATGQGASLTNREAVVPSVRFNSDYELVRDWLQLDLAASARQTDINPFAPGGTTSGRDNTDIVYDYTAGALLQRRLAQTADLSLRYAYNEQFNTVDVNGDSSEDRVEFDLGTLPGSGRFSLGVGGRYSKVNYDASELRPAFDNTLSSAELRAALQLSSSWQLNALVGEEWNEFTSVRDDIEGDYWDVGVRWTPNPRVEVSVGSGERFFGSTPRADFRYRHKRSELSASYARTLTFPRNLRVGDSGFLELGDPFGPGFGEFPGDPLGQEGLPTLIGDSPILNERFDLRYRFTARRSTIGLSGSDSRQRRTEDDAEATFRGAAITFSRSLSSLLSANLSLSWDEREGSGGDLGGPGGFGGFGEASEAWRAGFGFSRRLGNDTTLNVAYQFLTQESDFALNDYDENRVTFNVRHAF